MLVDGYLRTIETVYRVLHVPIFKREYNALWNSSEKPDPSFLVKLKLVFAIGSTFYDENFALRASAVRWVCEAQTWLSEPIFKSRLSISSLQTQILLLIARETAAVGGELVWISSGSLFRTAIYMGLHRDPARSPTTPTLEAEMRRRLWNTVLEIVLQSSMDSGGPPLISLDHFDTAPPGNFDDEQLTASNTLTKPDEEFTETSIAICFRRTFPLRLAIIKSLNNINTNSSYEKTLHFDSELRASHKTLSETLRAFNLNSRRPVPAFGARVIDIIMCRYLLTLHTPVFDASLHKATYAYSRTTSVNMALKIWTSLNSSPSTLVSPNTTPYSLDRDDLLRLALCGRGFFHTVAFHASFVIAADLRTQLREHDSLEPLPLRLDFLAVIEDTKVFALRCIEAGETNIKNHLMISFCAAEIEALIKGLPKDGAQQLLIASVKDSVSKCLSIFESQAAQYQTQDTTDPGPIDGALLHIPDDLMEDWDFMVGSHRGTNEVERLIADCPCVSLPIRK